jgi:hypothetical protein
MVSSHPSTQSLAAFVDRMLDAAERREIERHLSLCPDCRGIVMDSALFILTLLADEGPPVRTWLH